MKRSIIACLILAVLMGLLAGCCMQHSYVNADCFSPITCEKCGKTQGEPLGHDWQGPTCTEAMFCTRCRQTAGNPPGHKWMEASCTAPMTCLRCGATEGETLDHSFKPWYECDEEEMMRFCPLCLEMEAAPLDRELIIQGLLYQTRWIAVCETPYEDQSQIVYLEEPMDMFFREGTDLVVRVWGIDFPATWEITDFVRDADGDEYKGSYRVGDGADIPFSWYKDESGEYLFVFNDETIVCFMQYTTGCVGAWIPEDVAETAVETGQLPDMYIYIWEDGTIGISQNGGARYGILYDAAGSEYHSVEGMELDRVFWAEMDDGEKLWLTVEEDGTMAMTDGEGNETTLVWLDG